MFKPHRIATVPLVFAVLLASAAVPRAGHAGLSDAALALAGPLAEQFGVPSGAVTALLKSGVSLDSVSQLLLVSQSSKAGFDDVTKLFRESGNDIAKTAEKLDVDAAEYSQEKVTAVIDEAKAKAQADAKQRTADKAKEALGGLIR